MNGDRTNGDRTCDCCGASPVVAKVSYMIGQIYADVCYRCKDAQTFLGWKEGKQQGWLECPSHPKLGNVIHKEYHAMGPERYFVFYSGTFGEDAGMEEFDKKEAAEAFILSQGGLRESGGLVDHVIVGHRLAVRSVQVTTQFAID